MKGVNKIKKLTIEQQKLVEDNHNLIYKFMKQHNLKDDEINDWYGTCAIGMCKAARSYNKDKGKFSTLAYICMNTEVCQVFKKEEKQIRNMVSLDCPIKETFFLRDIISNDIDIAKMIELQVCVNNAMNKMSTQHRDVISMLTNDYLSISDIARKKNFSRQRVHKIVCNFRDLLSKELAK